MRLVLFLLFAIAVAATGARAEPLSAGGGGRVVEVVDGDTVLLDDGVEVRMVGIQAPKLPLGRAGFEAWPLADEAKAALEALILGKTVTLSYGGRRMDRHGRALAHLHGPQGGWIQGEMLRLGLARVYSFHDNTALVDDMLALEREARGARRGIWAHRYYRVLNATETPKFIDTFRLVEGRILDAARVRGRMYLNFGEDWRSDFTVTMSPRDMKRFTGALAEPSHWKGRRIRVRGWLKVFNGPMIEATHPQQIELLD